MSHTLRADRKANEEQNYDFMKELSQATTVKDCDFSLTYDQSNPSEIRMANSLIKSLEKRYEKLNHVSPSSTYA